MKFFKKLAVIFLSFGLSLQAMAAVVLEYHHVSDKGPASTRITPEAFIAHLDYLQEADFTVVPLMELVERLHSGEALPDRSVAITFDDAYASVYLNAYPILKKRKLPFTFFVNTDAVGTSPLFVSWSQLKEMQKNGATIANHTATHEHMVRQKEGETHQQWKARLTQDITRAQDALISHLGEAPKIFAYPFGEYNQAVKDVVRALGYIAFGQHSGVMSETGDKLIIPRFPFGGSYTDLADFKTKINSKALPLTHVQWFDQHQTPLKDIVIKAGERPWLVLSLAKGVRAEGVRCFATGQGAIVTQNREGVIWAQANTAFKPGRMRYNCTAPSDESGRFYWFTQQWLVTDENGRWIHKD